MMQRISTEILANTNQQTPAIDGPGPSERSFVEALVDPASVFRDPEEVVHHPWFTHQEKRTILLSWVRDELVVEQVASKTLPELRSRSRIDAVIKALAQFDPQAAGEYRSAAASIRTHQLCSSFRHKRTW
jgi:F0F1-type ATP synthase delta subunit